MAPATQLALQAATSSGGSLKMTQFGPKSKAVSKDMCLIYQPDLTYLVLPLPNLIYLNLA